MLPGGLEGHGPSPARSFPSLALAMAVPVASLHTLPAAYAGLGNPRPFMPVPPKRSIEFRFQEFLDEAANAGQTLCACLARVC